MHIKYLHEYKSEKQLELQIWGPICQDKGGNTH